MSNYRKQLGGRGEVAAAKYLRQQGYEIIDQNVIFYGGQLDLVCRNGEEIVFVEVKTRTKQTGCPPEEVLSYHQLKTIIRSARRWFLKKNLSENNYYWRIDLLYCYYQTQTWQFELLTNVAFLR